MLETYTFKNLLVLGYVAQFKLGGFLISSLSLSFYGCDLNITEFISLDIPTQILPYSKDIIKTWYVGLSDSLPNMAQSPIYESTRLSNIHHNPHYHPILGCTALKGISLYYLKFIVFFVICGILLPVYIILLLVYRIGILVSEIFKNWWLYVKKTRNNCEEKFFPRSDKIYSNTDTTVIPEDVNRFIVLGDDGEGNDDRNNNNNNNNNNGIIALPEG